MVDLPTPRRPRNLSLDFWRGVACLMVVVVHSIEYRFDDLTPDSPRTAKALLVHIGWSGVILDKVTASFGLGVSIFFVISGYCIAASCDSARRRPRAMGTFYLRRFRRIFPPYWIYLGLVAFLFLILGVLRIPTSILLIHGGGVSNPWTMGPGALFGNLSLTSTWLDRFLEHGGMISGQAWSLCYEEQFYFISGLLIWLMPRYFFSGIAAVSAVVLALFVVSPHLGLDLHGFFFDGFWLVFAAGVLAYYRCNYLAGRSALASDLFVLIAFVAFAVFRPHTRWISDLFFPLGLAFTLLLCSLHRWDAKIASMRLLDPVTFCGRMCYSLYLVHVPIVLITCNLLHQTGVRGYWATLLMTVPICLGLSIGAAHVFSLVVERRFLNPATWGTVLAAAQPIAIQHGSITGNCGPDQPVSTG